MFVHETKTSSPTAVRFGRRYLTAKLVGTIKVSPTLFTAACSYKILDYASRSHSTNHGSI